MSRVARMLPHVYTDKTKQRHFIEIRVPKEVRAIIGGKEKRKHTFPKHVTKDEAEAQSVDILKSWDAEWGKVLPQPPRYWHHIEPLAPGRTVRMLPGQLPFTFDDVVRLTRELAERQPSPAGPAFTFEPEPPAETITPAKRVTPYPESVDDWAVKLGKGDTTKKRQLSKMKRLFDWLAIRRDQPGFDDMNAVTDADLIAYEDESLSAMVATGTWKQPTVDDHIIQIKAGFSHARRRLHIDSDPSPVLRSYHRADDGANSGDADASWEKYSKTEAADILTRAAAADHPLVKFGNWIAAHHGSRAAEIAEARTNHIYQDEETGMWVFDYTLKDRPKGRRIKTGFSARRLPLPDVIVHDLGLLDYIERARREYHGGEDGDLFPMLKEREQRLNKDASRVLMGFLRDECDIKDELKVFHSWRSYVASALDGKVPETRARKVTGHAPRTKAERYIQYDLSDLAAAIKLIPVPAPMMAAAAD